MREILTEILKMVLVIIATALFFILFSLFLGGQYIPEEEKNSPGYFDHIEATNISSHAKTH